MTLEDMIEDYLNNDPVVSEVDTAGKDLLRKLILNYAQATAEDSQMLAMGLLGYCKQQLRNKASFEKDLAKISTEAIRLLLRRLE